MTIALQHTKLSVLLSVTPTLSFSRGAGGGGGLPPTAPITTLGGVRLALAAMECRPAAVPPECSVRAGACGGTSALCDRCPLGVAPAEDDGQAACFPAAERSADEQDECLLRSALREERGDPRQCAAAADDDDDDAWPWW